MTLSDDDKSCVIALVHAHIANSDEYMSWVPSYHTIRRCKKEWRGTKTTTLVNRISRCYGAADPMMCVRVGGHFRRKALYRKLLSALKCTCKFEDLSVIHYWSPPLNATKRRWDENGTIIPINERTFEFF